MPEEPTQPGRPSIASPVPKNALLLCGTPARTRPNPHTNPPPSAEDNSKKRGAPVTHPALPRRFNARSKCPRDRKIFAISRAEAGPILPIAGRAVIIWGERHVTDPREPPCGIVSTDRVFSNG